MEKPTVTHNMFVIDRSYPASPDRVFAAFSDPVKKQRWFAEGEHRDIEEFTMDFRVGGAERTCSRFGESSPFKGTALTNDTVYLDILPNRRIVFAYTMTVGDRRISSSQATLEFLPKGTGTDLIFTEQAAFFEGADGLKIREEGWRKILARLDSELP